VPDARKRGRQQYCAKGPCRTASQTESRRRWLKKPGNADYFRGPANVVRVQTWRKANPGYWRDSKRRRAGALQDLVIAEVSEEEALATQDATGALQETLTAQSPLLVGLISHLAGSALQEEIAAMTRRLHSRGRAVLGTDVPRPIYAKTPDRKRPDAARAAFV
jgi:hypothetical protein